MVIQPEKQIYEYMKIAIHQPRLSYYYGGGERVPLEQAHYFSKWGNEVFVITTDIKNKSKLFLDFQKDNPRVKIIGFKPTDKLKTIYKKELGQNRYRIDAESLEFGRMTKQFYLENQFDIVATHYSVDSLYIPKNQYVILELHGCPKYRRNIDECALSRANALVCVAKYVGDYWRKLYSIKEPIHLTYNGINNRYFQPKEIQKTRDVLYVGRLIKIKGVDDLLRSLRFIISQFPSVKIVIIGKGPEDDNLHALAKKLQIEKHIAWKRSVSDGELLNLYNASKICVFPSIAKEGVLTTLLEAAACGSAIITTKCCGMPEFIENKVDGLLVKPHCPKELSLVIRKLLVNDKVRSCLGENACIKIMRYWTWEKRAKELVKVYEQCVKGQAV